jgi:hypothetical protein
MFFLALDTSCGFHEIYVFQAPLCSKNTCKNNENKVIRTGGLQEQMIFSTIYLKE